MFQQLAYQGLYSNGRTTSYHRVGKSIEALVHSTETEWRDTAGTVAMQGSRLSILWKTWESWPEWGWHGWYTPTTRSVRSRWRPDLAAECVCSWCGTDPIPTETGPTPSRAATDIRSRDRLVEYSHPCGTRHISHKIDMDMHITCHKHHIPHILRDTEQH